MTVNDKYGDWKSLAICDGRLRDMDPIFIEDNYLPCRFSVPVVAARTTNLSGLFSYNILVGTAEASISTGTASSYYS